MKRTDLTPGLTLVALLALVQAIAGILRALQWIQVGSDLAGRGLLLLPIIGVFAVTRGVIVGAIAVLYALFAWAALARRGWARPIGVLAIIVNAVIVLSLLLGGAPAERAAVWLIVPVVVATYLFAPAGRRALGSARP